MPGLGAGEVLSCHVTVKLKHQVLQPGGAKARRELRSAAVSDGMEACAHVGTLLET